MVRHVIYLNGKWEKGLPINTLKYIVIALIIVMIVFLIVRRKNYVSSGRLSALWTMSLNLWTVYFLIFFNTEKNRGFYILGICFVIAAVLQNVINYLYTS